MSNNQAPAGEKFYDEATHQWLETAPSVPAPAGAKVAKPVPKDKE